MPDKTDFYRRLNIGTGASEEAIKQAYRQAVKKTHPDVNKHTGATQHFLDIQEAYEVLSHPDKKGAYDKGREPDDISTTVHTTQEYSQSALLRQEEPQIIYTLLDIVSSEDDARDISDLPLNISLVLDTSTSMAGARMDILKAATKEIIQDLDEDDMVSVVSFNDRAKVLMTSQANPTPTQIETSLNSLIAEGGTEIFQGLDAGYEEIKRQTTYEYVNHIILITDGHTYGDEDNCIMLAKRAASQDIGISGFGIGIEWNDEFVDQLCALTGGHCSFIQEQRNLKDFLKTTISSLKQASSRRVSLEVIPAPGVKMLSAFRIHPESLPLPITEEYALGILRKHQPHRVLFEFLIDPIPKEIDLAVIASGEFILKRRLRDQSFPFTLERTLVATEDELEPPIQEMFTAISHLTFFRLQEKAQRDVTSGNPGTAYQRLINLSSHLMAKGEDSLARIAMNEAEHIKSHSNFSPDGKKQLKYGTIRLMLPDKT
jgi:Ca-activated chloride channel family protein